MRPLAGRLIAFNDDLLDDPSAINVDKYGEGWLFEIEARRQRIAVGRTSICNTWTRSGKSRNARSRDN